MENALHIDSTGSSKRVLTTNQSTIRIQKNGNVQIVGMYCTNVVVKTNSAFSCPKTSTIDDVNILWRTQRRLKFESGSKRVNASPSFYFFVIWLFRIISIPSKFCYFRPPDHVISMELLALNFRYQCTTKTPIDMCRFNVRSST